MTLKVIKEKKLSDPIKGDLWVILIAEDNGYTVSVETEKEILFLQNLKEHFISACKFYEILLMQIIAGTYLMTDQEKGEIN